MIVDIHFEEVEYEALVKLAQQNSMTVEQYVYHCVLEHIDECALAERYHL